MKKFYAHFQIK